jgi:lipopolysaccharide transport system ATP-binding protein
VNSDAAVARPENKKDDSEQLLFDADDPGIPEGGAEIESAGFYTVAGEKLRVAGGGEVMEIRLVCSAHRNIESFDCAFVVRDRLGQVIFSDDTSSSARQPLAAGNAVTATFRFLLPYLANGAYALESFVFERRRGAPALLQHRTEKGFLYIQSPHPSNGLANIAMRSVILRRETPEDNDHDTGAEPATAAGGL